MPSEELTTRTLISDDPDLYLDDHQVSEVSPEEFFDPESPVDIDEPASSSDSFTLSDAWASFRKTTESYAESAFKHGLAFYKDTRDTYGYLKTTSWDQIASDAAKKVAAAYPEETAAVADFVAENLPTAVEYAAPVVKALLPDVINPDVNPLVRAGLEYAKNAARGYGEALVRSLEEYAAVPAGSLAPSEVLVAAEETITTDEMIETVAAAEAPQSTAVPVSLPLAGEEWIDPWGYGDDYGIADEEGEIVETDIVAVAEEDVAAPVVTTPVEEAVVVAQTGTAPDEVKKEEPVDVTDESEKAESSKKAVVVQTTTKQTDVTSVSEDEGFAVSVEYAPELSTGAGVATTAGQAAFLSASARTAETTLKPRQKANLPQQAVRETVAAADKGETSREDGVAGNVSVSPVSVEAGGEVKATVADPKTGKPFSTKGRSAVAGAGGLTEAERVAASEAVDGVVEDAGLAQSPVSAQTVSGKKDSSTSDPDLIEVASSLDAPLNDVPGSSDKGFDSNDEGRDRSVENIHALADAGDDVAEEIAEVDVIDSSIIQPSDVVV